MKLTLLAQCTDWVLSVLIIREKSPAVYRMTIDYRPINKETVKNTWSTLHVDKFIDDMFNAKVPEALQLKFR